MSQRAVSFAYFFHIKYFIIMVLVTVPSITVIVNMRVDQ